MPWPFPHLRHLGDLDFLKAIHARYGSVPKQVFDDPDLRGMVLPGLRADFALIETYQYIEKESLSCPITAFGGEQDSTVPVETLSAWRQHSSSFCLRFVQGNHLCLSSVRQHLVQALSDELGNRSSCPGLPLGSLHAE